MSQFSFKFKLFASAPQDDQEAEDFSTQLTDEMGFDGWQLSSTIVLENGALLVGFQKESS